MGAPGWSSWLNIAAEVGIIALPVGLLMISGEFDISVGSIVPASSMMTAMLAGHYELPALVAICGGLAIGIAVGFVNGLLVTRTTIPSLIVTIGVMFAVMGLTLGFAVLIKGSTSVSYVPAPMAKALLGQFINDMFNVAILWWLGFAAVFFCVLHISPIGNWIFAIGGDRESARNAGIPTSRVTIGLFMGLWILCGLCRSCAGDDLPTGTGCRRAGLYLQFNHVRGDRRRASDRRVGVYPGHPFGNNDFCCREPRRLFCRARPQCRVDHRWRPSTGRGPVKRLLPIARIERCGEEDVSVRKWT